MERPLAGGSSKKNAGGGVREALFQQAAGGRRSTGRPSRSLTARPAAVHTGLIRFNRLAPYDRYHRALEPWMGVLAGQQVSTYLRLNLRQPLRLRIALEENPFRDQGVDG